MTINYTKYHSIVWLPRSAHHTKDRYCGTEGVQSYDQDEEGEEM
jgi:hypothetical protein